MLSEVRIQLGGRADEYATLSITTLDLFERAEFFLPSTRGRTRRTKRVRLFWRDETGGRSRLMVDAEPARDLTDPHMVLERRTDSHGSNHYAWVADHTASKRN
jgi:hypothetical protein